ncbi:probable helicase with zinc finger domain isoform X2 [Cimex lectularius]|nr:probable helicase with zinc finger domain isoform X2 [Cimex lectularius]XP_014248251.1 probable helicase with zinc finger domain isoform X2 [Cimex lectularius]XP_024086171.1 probable helicase with zinc finger domain isoform X2 [Cimex lectularius]
MSRLQKDIVQKSLACIYCGLSFSTRSELKAHCQTEAHQTVIMSDEGRDWKWRPPPRGHIADNYTLCENWVEMGTCRYGAQCVEAHGAEELSEWKQRFEYRRMKLQRACEKELYGKSYTEQLLERWSQTSEPSDVMREKIDDISDSCSSPLVTTMSSKVSRHLWTFTINTHLPLKAVALLQDTHRNHFNLSRITTTKGVQQLLYVQLKGDQEWTGDIPAEENADVQLVHTVEVGFNTDIYGTFRQSVVFDFGTSPTLVKHLCVDVMPVTDADKMKELKKELVLTAAERWNSDNTTIVPYSPSTDCELTKRERERDQELMAAYPPPSPDTFTLTQSTVTEKRPNRANYRARIHELLYVEEMARYQLVANYNLEARLQLAKNYLLSPSGVAASTAKYAQNGELFALLSLGKNVSEDTSAGRLILNNCATVLLSPAKQKGEKDKTEGEDQKRVVYESIIEDKGKNIVYLRLSASTVQALNLKADTKVLMDVQFQLNRVPYCEWHQAIDKIADFRIIFPETYVEPTIPWSPQRQWSGPESKLNPKQREAVMAITTPLEIQLPPILIIGPFGTGKTYTLAHAIKEVLKQPGTRVLVCTHSNSAADLYIKDYLHPYVEAGHEEARPLRIFYHRRWVSTVNHIVQKYAIFETNDQGVRTFKVPKVEDILKHRVIVVTLSISMHLSNMGLRKGHFTHILLDEAAQAMECEAIMPLALATDTTRIVLAGDHMQLSPELFSEFAKERNLHISVLERLYDHYPASFPCKILLCENYRAHEAIIQFTSELFYEQKLVSSGKQPRHDYFYPLTFFTTRGEDVQDHNSTAFYNNAEVYEVVERVCELKKRWPPSWGKLDDQSIGIMTPYSDQVFRIRSELRKRRLGGISVERVLNVQGKQFRAIFLSTVRTRRTCNNKSGAEVDYGFLSNSKLLNTAITRAQSLVAVVGDPIALCSIGRCRKVWERFIEICDRNGSLFGIKWSYLRSQLDGVELKRVYTLNPLAPEFIPRQYREPRYFVKPLLGGYPLLRYGPPPLPVPPVMSYPMYYPPPAIFSIRPIYPYLNPYQTNVPLSSNQNFLIKDILGSNTNTMPLHSVQPPPPPAMPNSPLYYNQLLAQQQQQQQLKQQQLQQHTSQPQQLQHMPQQHISLQQQNSQQMLLEKKTEKRDIQFLNNVHFPERQCVLPLLPNDVSIDELLDSQTKQLEWFNFLQGNVGLDAAAKFADFITKALAARKPPPQSDLSGFGDLQIAKPPPYKYITSPQVKNGPFNTSSADPPSWRVLSEKPLSQLASLFATDCSITDLPQPRNGSVPLYQRQPGTTNTYANAVKAQNSQDEEKDLLAGLRDLGNKALGVYQYFS